MLALLTVVFGTAWGGSITFADLGLENGVQYTDPFDGGDFTVTFSGGANDGKYYTTGSGIRVYGNGSMTVAAKSGNLSQITITFSGAYKPETADVVDNGTYDPETGVWTGSAASVVFTRPAGSGHWRIQKVEAVVGGASPTLSINGTTPFVESTQVTITPSNSDFAVYYSTDGSDPGTNPIVYTGPFTITETTTVKAVEEDLEGNLSAVVEKTFVKQELNVQTVADIAAFKALEDGTEANLKLTNAQVLYAGTSDIYVRDASGAIDFYNTGLKLTTGQMLNGSVIGKRATYNNIPELVKSDNTNSNAITATNGTATPIVLTVAQAKDEQYYCNLIRIEGVKVVAKQEGNYTNYYAYVGNDSIMIYDRFKVGLGDWNENDTYNLEGILVPYKGAFEVYITQSLAGGTTPPDPGVTVCDNIAAFKALSSGTEAELKLDNAKVLYAKDRDVYVRDASGAIEFYNLGINFETDQVLNGSIIGKYSPYNNLPEIAKTDKTNADKITFSTGSPAQPVALTLAQAQDMKYVCDLVTFDNVNIVEADGAFSLSDGQSTLALFNKFKIDLAAANATKVTGILVIFKEAYQLYPITIGGGETPPDPGVPVCDNIAAFKALESGTEAELKLDNAKVLYAKDRDVYVRDASGAIEFYNLGINFETDQVLNGSIIGKYSPYNNLPEIAKTDKTNADKITFSAGSPAQPIALTLAQAQDMKYICELVSFDNVNVVEADGNFSLSDGQSTLTLYNKFKIDLAAANAVKATGILVIFKEAYQLYPISIDINQGIDQLTTDDMMNAPAYNLAGQRVDASYKGVVIQNGRKLLRK